MPEHPLVSLQPEVAGKISLHLGVEDHLASSPNNWGIEDRMDSSPHHFQAGESPQCIGVRRTAALRDTTVQFSCNPLGYGYFASPTTESQTGQSAHQKANQPSQAHHLSQGRVVQGA